MPDPERLLTTIHRAIALTRAQPERCGRVLALSSARDLLIAGDLHGHIGNLQTILRAADLARQPQRHLVLQELIHGQFRYSDGSEKSHQLVDLYCALKCQYPERVHYLLGNHELSQMTDRLIAKSEVDLNAAFRDGVDTAYGSRGAEIYAAYMKLFACIPVAIRTTNRVFLSHSLPSAAKMPNFRPSRLELEPTDPPDLMPGGSIHALVWGRDTHPSHVASFLKTVDADWLITGHISCPEEGFALPNPQQLILDSLGSPGAACLLPTDRPLDSNDLITGLIRW